MFCPKCGCEIAKDSTNARTVELLSPMNLLKRSRPLRNGIRHNFRDQRSSTHIGRQIHIRGIDIWYVAQGEAMSSLFPDRWYDPVAFQVAREDEEKAGSYSGNLSTNVGRPNRALVLSFELRRVTNGQSHCVRPARGSGRRDLAD